MNRSFEVYTRKEKQAKELAINNFRSTADKIIYPFFASSVAWFCFSIFKLATAVYS